MPAALATHREMAEEVLRQRRVVATDLIGSKVIESEGKIGYEVKIPYPGDSERFVSSSPVFAVREGVTRSRLKECFDAGMDVCRDLADQIAATP